MQLKQRRRKEIRGSRKACARPRILAAAFVATPLCVVQGVCLSGGAQRRPRIKTSTRPAVSLCSIRNYCNNIRGFVSPLVYHFTFFSFCDKMYST